MDVLTDVLNTLALKGWLSSRRELVPPWRYEFTASPDTVFHIIRAGGMLARQEMDVLVVNARYTPSLRSVGNGSCIEGSRYSWTRGAPVKHTFCNFLNSEQRFRIKPVAGSQNIVNLINTSNGYCLDVKNGSTSNGADAIQQSCNGSSSQQWHLTAIDNGAYTIAAVHSDKCLEAKTGLFVNDVEQNSCQTGNQYQQWRLD